MSAARTGGAFRFGPGARVRVGTGDPPGHIRTPMYLRGKEGRVVRSCGAFRNPERLAHGGDGLPRLPLYVVSFLQTEVWPDYAGPAIDTLTADLYEHWLDPAGDEAATG